MESPKDYLEDVIGISFTFLTITRWIGNWWWYISRAYARFDPYDWATRIGSCVSWNSVFICQNWDLTHMSHKLIHMFVMKILYLFWQTWSTIVIIIETKFLFLNARFLLNSLEFSFTFKSNYLAICDKKKQEYSGHYWPFLDGQNVH